MLTLVAPGLILWGAHTLVDRAPKGRSGTAAVAASLFASLRSGSWDDAGVALAPSSAADSSILHLTYA